MDPSGSKKVGALEPESPSDVADLSRAAVQMDLELTPFRRAPR